MTLIKELKDDKRLLDLISKSNIPKVTLEADEHDNLIVDKELNPDIYDWVVNG